MYQVSIYGATVELPDVRNLETWGTDDPSEQYWRRRELPKYFEEVEFDKEGNAILTMQQREYALEEVRRCKEGFWFMNNGFETFVTGKHYFYLTYWKLEKKFLILSEFNIF